MEVNVGGVLAEAAARHRLTAESAGVVLSIADVAGVVVHADRLQLVSAVSNLVDNAVKYSNAGGTVRLTAQVRAARSRSRWPTRAWVFLRATSTGSSNASTELIVRGAEKQVELGSGSPLFAI